MKVIELTNQDDNYDVFESSIVYGLGGNDLIYANVENITLFGGGGDGGLSVYGRSTAYGQDGDDNIYSEAGGLNTMYGGRGSDQFISVSSEGDRLYGEDGNDHFFIAGDKAVYVSGGTGKDDLSIDGYSNNEDGIYFKWDAASDIQKFENVVFTGIESVGFVGSFFDDYIETGSGDDTIVGLGGIDFLSGGGGNDTISGSDFGYSIMLGGSGDDTIKINLDGKSADGGTGVDTIVLDFRNDLYFSNYFEFYSDGRSVVLDGVGESQFVNFESVNLTGNSGDDVFYGGSFADRLMGHDGSDSLDGRGGNDSLDGGYGSDSLFGGDGNDTLAGGYEGDDWLEGGAGSDRLSGGSGNDTFVFGVASKKDKDVITDFSINDRLISSKIIRDNNGDGKIDFGSDGLLDIGNGKVQIFSETGHKITSVYYTGMENINGINYYQYTLESI